METKFDKKTTDEMGMKKIKRERDREEKRQHTVTTTVLS
jgi:hypothetical protein